MTVLPGRAGLRDADLGWALPPPAALNKRGPQREAPGLPVKEMPSRPIPKVSLSAFLNWDVYQKN